MGGTEDTGSTNSVRSIIWWWSSPGAQNFNGEMAAELIRLSEAGRSGLTARARAECVPLLD
jgi:hypothetical protein